VGISCLDATTDHPCDREATVCEFVLSIDGFACVSCRDAKNSAGYEHRLVGIVVRPQWNSQRSQVSDCFRKRLRPVRPKVVHAKCPGVFPQIFCELTDLSRASIPTEGACHFNDRFLQLSRTPIGRIAQLTDHRPDRPHMPPRCPLEDDLGDNDLPPCASRQPRDARRLGSQAAEPSGQG
jgi:hypothetical protein